MEQRTDFLTFSTADLDAARAFYRDGLGWTPLLDVPGEIVFFQVGHGLVLGLFDAGKFAEDLGVRDAPIRGVTLSHNVAGPEAVGAAVERAVAAGGTVLKEPQEAAFGGYHAHVADPNGLVWEIAHNPAWSVEPDGTVRLGLIG
ncbi:VOC family protein [Streptomyces sp. NRRL F-5126]|uniref:VOC family protein n=1 Tax=Streptomyces sp. NRRL F-5126 TaxID=1463857 RepID=UPI0004CB4E6B|nr:VOC family protein [Streptomyces sp. NRRL F-5126]